MSALHRMTSMPAAALVLAALFGAANVAATSRDAGTASRVQEAWESARTPKANLDSLVAWKTADGAVWLLATAKETHEIVVFDASTGATLHRVGAPGKALGSFRRPNGIAIAGDLALVVERDNRRVQALALPDLTPVGSFGEQVLKRPYGITVRGGRAGEWQVFVTDAYELSTPKEPRADELGERVKHFRVRRAGSSIDAELVRSFGDRTDAGALRVVESIHADPGADTLVIAEEHLTETSLKVYDVDGRFTGRVAGRDLFAHQVEGIALRTCADGGGVWVVSDQGALHTQVHLLDRRTLEPLGMFTGHLTANTDGIAIYAEPFNGFPDGALFAVHDDMSVTAFRWGDVVDAVPAAACST